MGDKKVAPYLRVLGREEPRPTVDAEHERELANVWFSVALFTGLFALVGLLAFRTTTGPMVVTVFGAITILAAGLFVYHDRRSDRG